MAGITQAKLDAATASLASLGAAHAPYFDAKGLLRAGGVNASAAVDTEIARAIGLITPARLTATLAMLTRTWNTRNSFARPSPIPSPCTPSTRAGIEWRR